MMKHLSVFLLLWGASVAMADDASIERYVNAHISMLQAQIEQLHSAIALLSNEPLSDQEKFERIGQPGFAAVDKSLYDAGYSVKNFYQFKADNDVAITEWLSRHATDADYINSLLAEFDSLMVKYDQVIKTTKTGN